MSHHALGVPVETWSAVGSISTAVGVLAAAVGAWLAYRQLRENRHARLDQSRPYVLVTIEQGPTLFGFLDIVVRNVGAGPAHNVRIKPEPRLQRSPQQNAADPDIAEVRYFNEPIPLMPPGYQLSTYFDYAPDRCQADPPLPDCYTFTVSYDDGHGHSWTEANVADLGLTHDLMFHEVYTLHHAAEALQDIRSQLKQSPLLRGTVDATIETRNERAARLRAQREDRRTAIEELRKQHKPLLESSTPEAPGSGSNAE